MPNAPPSRRLLAILFMTGFLGIGYEVLVVRVASQVFENTVYSFASLLAIYLLGTSTGAAVYQWLLPRRDREETMGYLFLATSAFCLVGMLMLRISVPFHSALLRAAIPGIPGSVMVEMATSLFIFFLPTLAMGATFSHLAQMGYAVFSGMGWALCANSIGAALAPLFFGVILLPAFGSKSSLLLVSIAYLLLIPSQSRLRPFAWALPPLLAGGLLLGPIDFRFVTLSRGSQVNAHVEGVMAAVTVVGDARGENQLRVNDKFVMGGTSSYYSDRRQGHIPLLLHPNPQRALYLGLGTGATFAAAADYSGLEADGVELIPEVIPLLHFLEKSAGDIRSHDRLHIMVADARRFVRATPRTYDVVVADLFHPARDGSGSLYTTEHFEAVKGLLNRGGIFCQWLPLYQMDLDTLRVIVRTFLQVFPEGSAFLAHYSLQSPIIGLISGGPSRYPHSWLQQRVSHAALGEELKRLRLNTTYSLLGGFIAGNAELADFAGRGPVNTDDRPIVLFEAPRFLHSQPGPASGRLLELLSNFHPRTDDILQKAETEDDLKAHERLAAYWIARNEFLEAGIRMTPMNNMEALMDETKEVLFSSLRKSPDFEAAYYPLLAMAENLRTEKPTAAWELLMNLEATVPDCSDARELRNRLFPHIR